MEFRGAAHRLLQCTATECLISGAAGTGKSIAALTKLHYLCERIKGLRCLIVRKTRESLTESALVTFESKVVAPNHPILAGASRAMRQAYRYPIGSTIVCGGLDKPGKIFSTEWDLIYAQEAIDLNENAWEALTTRLRNNVLPYQQLMGDTNPDAPTHWLKRRCDEGRTVLLESRHEDNPAYYDADAATWTQAGLEYLAKLDALTGPRLLRLRHGRWVQAEGVVYDEWDRHTHLINRFEVPLDWPRYWVVDFGYSNPFVCGFWAKDHDGRLYRYREIYKTKRLVEDHARHMLEIFSKEVDYWTAKMGYPCSVIEDKLRPRGITCDHDAEDRATLERHLKMGTRPARKAISPGIQAVQARLRVQGDGKPRLFLLHDSLVERDRELHERGLPCCTEEEIDSYVWRDGKKKEEPIDENNHGMDVMRYAIAQFDLIGDMGEIPSSAPAAPTPPPETPFRYGMGEDHRSAGRKLFGRK